MLGVTAMGTSQAGRRDAALASPGLGAPGVNRFQRFFYDGLLIPIGVRVS
jgi:hypothetical protein